MTISQAPMLLSEVMDLFGLQYEQVRMLQQAPPSQDGRARVDGGLVVRIAGYAKATIEEAGCRWCRRSFHYLRRQTGGRNPVFCCVGCRQAEADSKRYAEKLVDIREPSGVECI